MSPERVKAPVAKTFRRFEPDQVLLLPPSLDEWLPADHLARFVAELVDGVLDLSGIYADYTEARGYPPYEPRVMVRLLVYGYTTGVRSSRADRAALCRRCRLPLPGRRAGPGLPVDREVPSPTPGRAGRAVRADPAAGDADRSGADGPGGGGRDEAAGERQQAQGDELPAAGGAGGHGRRRGRPAARAHRRHARRRGGDGRGRGRPVRRRRAGGGPAGRARPP